MAQSLPLLVICQDNAVHSTTLCLDAKDLEARFAAFVREQGGRDVEEAELDNGYVELPDGRTACMSWIGVEATDSAGARTLAAAEPMRQLLQDEQTWLTTNHVALTPELDARRAALLAPGA